MSVFVVLSSAPDPALEANITNRFPGQWHRMSDRAWFIAAGGMTAQRLSETLGLGQGGPNVVVATLSGSYWGFAQAGTWEFLKNGFERQPHG